MAMPEVADPFAHRKQTSRIVDQIRRRPDLRWDFPSRSPPARIAHETAATTGIFRTFAGFAPLRETKNIDPPTNAARRSA